MADKMTHDDPLADVIEKATVEHQDPHVRRSVHQAAAVRAYLQDAGYRSPKELAAILDAEKAKWRMCAPGHTAVCAGVEVIDILRATLGIDTKEDASD